MITEEWLRKIYLDDVANVNDIAVEAGCGVANIRRLLKKWGIKRGKAFMIGKPAWNTGLTKETDERMAKLSLERSGEGNPMFGRESWNSGLTKETDERVMDVSIALTGREIREGSKEKMRQAKIGKFREQSNAWKGGEQTCNEYAMTVCGPINGHRIYKHRMVAEMILGRKLSTKEAVHHVDMNKKNNHPSNLLVMSIGSHSSLHLSMDCKVSSKEAQMNWLKAKNMHFEVLNEDK